MLVTPKYVELSNSASQGLRLRELGLDFCWVQYIGSTSNILQCLGHHSGLL